MLGKIGLEHTLELADQIEHIRFTDLIVAVRIQMLESDAYFVN